MAKLTLSVDPRVISGAKNYAKKRGLSVSGIVGAYLSAVSGIPSDAKSDTPILRSLKGCLKSAGTSDYREHLEAKYR